MSIKPTVVSLLDKRLGRRLIIAPAVVLLTMIGVVLSPLLVLGALIADTVQRRARWPRLRLVGLIVGALIVETVSMVVSLGIWIVTGFGFLGNERWRWQMHRGYMGVYTNTMLGLVRRIIGGKLDWRDNADLVGGPIILIARHTSFFDALIPATLLSRRNKLLSHHVVTHGLRYAPCIDIVGHRFPNRFIRRTPGEGSSELTSIEAVGAVLDERSAAIIFPEGTFRNDERFERAVRRIGRRQPELAARAAELTHVLPPRYNGTYALLQGAPTADVVICANTGFENFGSVKQILGRPFTDRPIIIETWRIDRSEIPQDPDDFNEWLFDQYVAMDHWVTAVRNEVLSN